tara:strand:+ start:5462 stop:5611 length:150 start_codon:yes stop_codon:yes gene_type:complete
MIDDKQYYNIIEDAAVRYREAYDILMEHFDKLPEDIKVKVHNKLKELKL